MVHICAFLKLFVSNFFPLFVQHRLTISAVESLSSDGESGAGSPSSNEDVKLNNQPSTGMLHSTFQLSPQKLISNQSCPLLGLKIARSVEDELEDHSGGI